MHVCLFITHTEIADANEGYFSYHANLFTICFLVYTEVCSASDDEGWIFDKAFLLPLLID